jgi:CRISPR-associated protein Csd1
MILQRLLDYYDRVSTDESTARALPKPGYSLQRVSFCVVLKPDGTLDGFQSLLDVGSKKPAPRQLLVPGQSKPTGQGINPCFLWDNATYMLGFKPDDPGPERTRKAFEKFRDRHVQVEQEVNDPSFTAVCKFLLGWSPERAAERASELAEIATHFGVFKIAGAPRFVHDDLAIVAYWASHGTEGETTETSGKGFCLVTGIQEQIARLHEPKIKGVAGTQSAGALLVSFNDRAYESFGKMQGDNAPVGVTAAFKYTNALNYLLNRHDRRTSVGDATVVFWAERPTMLEEVFDPFLGEYRAVADNDGRVTPEDKQRAEQVRSFLTQLRDGVAHGSAFDPDSDVGFYVLGLSPNASRISVRFWVQSTVGEMERRLAQHLQDVDLVGAREGDPPLMIRRIVEAAGRAKYSGGKFQGYDADAVPPLLSGAIARAVFQGTSYPPMLLGAMLNRLRADGHVSHARVATIKACIVRNSRFTDNPQEVPVALNTSRTDAPYVTGRLFALLERIQSDAAGGDLNSTIKDRYFSAASATPGTVFPRLIRLSQHHLSNLGKEKPGLKVTHDRTCGEIMGKLDRFASHFNLEEQGLFAVGYYHQRQDFYTSKKSKEEGAEE